MGWENSRFTTAGIALVRRCVDTGKSVRITKAAATDETWPAASLPYARTLAGEVRQELPVAQVDDDEVWKRLHLQVTPVGLTEGYQLRQVGIWARGDESETPILMFVMQDETGFAIPSAEDMPFWSMTLVAVLEIDDPGDLVIERECWVTPADESVSYRKLSPAMKKYDELYYDLPIKTGRAYDSDYYVISVPVEIDGDHIDPYISFEPNPTPTPLEHAQNTFTTLTINGNAALQVKTAGHDGDFIVGNTFSRGNLIFANDIDPLTELETNSAKYISINYDRSVTEFSVFSTAEELAGAGAYNLLTVYYKLIANYTKLDLSGVTINEGAKITDRFPFMVVGVTDDGTLKFIAVDGRSTASRGMLATEVQEICLQEGLRDAWAMDGGGSASMCYRGEKINRNHDGYGTQDRTIRFKLDVKREKSHFNEDLAQVVSQIGAAKQRLIQQIMPSVNKASLVMETSENVLDLALNMASGTAMYWYNGPSASWLPPWPYSTNPFIYGLFIIRKQLLGNTQRFVFVEAVSYSGGHHASNSYHDGKWDGWSLDRASACGTVNIPAVNAGETTTVRATFVNPTGSVEYIITATVENSSVLIASVSTRAESSVLFTIRNISEVNSPGGKLNYIIHF